MDWNAFITLLKEFKDFVFRPFTLLTFGFIGLILLTLPEPYLAQLRLANFVGQYGTQISIGTIFLLATGFIRFCDVYLFSWRRQRIELKKRRDNFQRQLDTLSIYELSILAYCLSRNRITFFVINEGRNAFENAVQSLTTRGFFRQGPLAIHGYAFDITDDYWRLLQHFKEDIRKRAEAIYPDLNQKFEFYDQYQKAYGFGQTEPPVEKKEIEPKSESQPAEFDYSLYTKDVFLDVIWKWHYKPEFGQKPLNLTPYCPDCERQLAPKPDLDGNAIFTDRITSKHYKRMVCPVHRKDYQIPVDKQKDYITIIADISKKIKSGKWKEIVDQQRK